MPIHPDTAPTNEQAPVAESGGPHTQRPPGQVVVATFNLHAGIDGWGRPYDALDACEGLDADVLVLTEMWSASGALSQAQTIAEALGYQVLQRALASGRRALPHPRANAHWMRPFDWRGAAHSIYLDSERRLASFDARSTRFAEAEPGTWGLALLSRLPVGEHREIVLGRLPRDRAVRALLLATLTVGNRELLVAATHMSHLSYGSPIHFRRVDKVLRDVAGDRPVVFAGDMNLWGPPLRRLMPGWRSAVRGRTWPAWRPHSQIDHILVRGPIAVRSGAVLGPVGSDHLPIRATLKLS